MTSFRQVSNISQNETQNPNNYEFASKEEKKKKINLNTYHNLMLSQ